MRVGQQPINPVSVHRRCPISMKDILRICSSALVPLMIGVMTFMMTIQQHRQGVENRQNDILIAKDLRDQQRALDDQRRAQDRDFQEQNRWQDLQIAEAVRQDLVLSTYLNEMTRLSIEFNFSLGKNVLKVVVRPKTLVALQQLNSRRKILLLEFLYESDLIRGGHVNFESTTALNGADLNNINLNPDDQHHRLFSFLSLVGAQLVNVTLRKCNLYLADFESASMIGASFSEAYLYKANFFRTSLVNTDFTDADVTGSDFGLANLTGSNITEKQLRSTLTYHRAVLPNGTLTLHLNMIKNGDAARCSLDSWSIDMPGSIEILHQDQNCLFKANRSRGDVSMSQKIRYLDSKMKRAHDHFGEIRIDIEKILPSNRSSSVKLTKSFLKDDGTLIDIGECFWKETVCVHFLFLQKNMILTQQIMSSVKNARKVG